MLEPNIRKHALRLDNRAAKHTAIRMTAEEQRVFWKALVQSPDLTKAQRELGAIMRGEELA